MIRFMIFMACFLAMSDIISQEKPTVEDTAVDIKVHVYGLKSDDGKIVISLFDSESNYNANDETKAAVCHQNCKIVQKKAFCVCRKMPVGDYAIRLYHDENNNDKIDTNFLGIPTEGYGFSNNAKGFFGPPGFQKTKFHFCSGYKVQRIKMNY